MNVYFGAGTGRALRRALRRKMLHFPLSVENKYFRWPQGQWELGKNTLNATVLPDFSYLQEFLAYRGGRKGLVLFLKLFTQKYRQLLAGVG